MNKQFYRSRNMPIQHSMILTPPDPPASTHQLPRMNNIEKLINKQISVHYQNKSKQRIVKQNIENVLKQSQQMVNQLQECKQQQRAKQVQHNKVIKDKDTKLFMVFCQVNRLSKINDHLMKQLDQLQFQNKNIHTHYNRELKKYKVQLQNKSQTELKQMLKYLARILKQQFNDCMDNLKFKYSERLGLLMKKDKQEELKVVEYKEIMKIMETQVELINKQKQNLEEEIREMKIEVRQKVKVLNNQISKRKEENLELMIKSNQQQFSRKLLEQKYNKILKLNKQYQSKELKIEKQDLFSSLQKSKLVNQANHSFQKSKDNSSEQQHQNQVAGVGIHPISNKSIPKKQSQSKFDENSQDNKKNKQKTKNENRSVPKVLYDQVNDHSYSQHQINNKTQQISALNKQIQSLKQSLKSQQQTYTTEIKFLQQSSIELNILINKLQTENSNIKDENNKLTILLQNMKRASEKAIDDKQYQIKQYRIRLGENENQITSLKQLQQSMLLQLQEHRSKNKEYMDILDMKSSRQISADIDQMKRDNQDLMGMVENLKKELNEKQLEISRLNQIFDNQEKDQSKEESKEQQKQQQQKEQQKEQSQKQKQQEKEQPFESKEQESFSQFENKLKQRQSEYQQHLDENFNDQTNNNDQNDENDCL